MTWEHCYHQGRGAEPVHYNVKLNGNGRWRGYNDTMRATEDDRKGLFDRSAVDELAAMLEDWDRENWWEDLEGFVQFDLGYKSTKVYSCGRSGGYVTGPNLNPEDLERLGEWLKAEREYHNSAEAGADLAARVLEYYDERELAALASPRPQRVEA